MALTQPYYAMSDGTKVPAKPIKSKLKQIHMYVALKLAKEGFDICKFVEIVQPVLGSHDIVSKLADELSVTGNYEHIKKLVDRLVAAKEFVIFNN